MRARAVQTLEVSLVKVAIFKLLKANLLPAAEDVSGPGGPGASWRGVAGRVGAGCLTNEINIQMDGGESDHLILLEVQFIVGQDVSDEA